MKTSIKGCALSLLVLAAAAYGPSAAQSPSDANSLLGSWSSPGVGNCPTAKNPGRPRMSPTSFTFTSVAADGSFDGTFSVGCNGPSGSLDRDRKVAKVEGGAVVVKLTYGPNATYVYTFTPGGGSAPGEMVTPSGDRVATVFEFKK
ncbi:MAG: hypothetical protein U1F33_12205 [Alphaproteobacteria bacterium]